VLKLEDPAYIQNLANDTSFLEELHKIIYDIGEQHYKKAFRQDVPLMSKPAKELLIKNGKISSTQVDNLTKKANKWIAILEQYAQTINPDAQNEIYFDAPRDSYYYAIFEEMIGIQYNDSPKFTMTKDRRMIRDYILTISMESAITKTKNLNVLSNFLVSAPKEFRSMIIDAIVKILDIFIKDPNSVSYHKQLKDYRMGEYSGFSAKTYDATIARTLYIDGTTLQHMEDSGMMEIPDIKKRVDSLIDLMKNTKNYKEDEDNKTTGGKVKKSDAKQKLIKKVVQSAKTTKSAKSAKSAKSTKKPVATKKDTTKKIANKRV
jgi:hypothetical protein